MRNKRSRKLVSILITLTMLVTLLVPMVGPASAATSYSMTSVTKVSSGYDSNVSGPLGSLLITMDGSSAISSVGKFVYFDLPSSPTGYEVFPSLTVGGASADLLATIANSNISNGSGTNFSTASDYPAGQAYPIGIKKSYKNRVCSGC